MNPYERVGGRCCYPPARRRCRFWRPWGLVVLAAYALTIIVCTLLRMWLA